MTDEDVDSQPARNPAPEPSTAEWDLRLKKYAVLVSVLALFTSASSALAAFLSWRTSQSSLELAHSVADKSGARLEVAESIRLEGQCPDLKAVVRVRNVGHLSGDVTNLQIYFVPLADPDRSGMIGFRTFGPVTVLPQTLEQIEVPFDCEPLIVHGLYNIDPKAMLPMVKAGIDTKFKLWVHPTYAVMNADDNLKHYPISNIFIPSDYP